VNLPTLTSTKSREFKSCLGGELLHKSAALSPQEEALMFSICYGKVNASSSVSNEHNWLCICGQWTPRGPGDYITYHSREKKYCTKIVYILQNLFT
jgi:hypothetical protein